ncbi:hypothetical protein [Alienimonas sp. DA493]|uniref:hypothetical protein n=1 Tax=Alienimonas sp. DA493 TaxID=3373605 RepID=UPI003754F130
MVNAIGLASFAAVGLAFWAVTEGPGRAAAPSSDRAWLAGGAAALYVGLCIAAARRRGRDR